MATPVDFPFSNDILKAAKGTEEWVSNLPIFRQGLSHTPDGQRLDPCVISCWKLSEEELAEVQRTGRIYFQAHGFTHPPINIYGICPIAVIPRPE